MTTRSNFQLLHHSAKTAAFQSACLIKPQGRGADASKKGSGASLCREAGEVETDPNVDRRADKLLGLRRERLSSKPPIP